MAQMYPRNLPADFEPASERKVFLALESGLDDDWHVFHSASWVARDHAEGAKDGEIDFVLGHPDEGILCLEVKGHGVESIHGQWYRTYKGDRQKIEDPFAQALDHKHDLRRKLEGIDKKRWKGAFIAHALAFPLITIHQLALAPDAPREILIDRHELEQPAEAIERVLAYHEGSRDKRHTPDADGIEALIDVLAPEVRIEVPMAAEFVDEEAALITLTFQQSDLLASFGRAKRMVVTGCAGSGKTMLAVEQAKRSAAKGADVAFVCFNKALRDHLQRTEGDSGIAFHTFHGLCTYLAHRAKLDVPRYPDSEIPQSYWSEELPDLLLEATEELGGQFDAIYVDEAQDLHNDWLDSLETTLRDPAKDQFWLFMDDNQRVYDQRLDVPDDFVPYDLTTNCRNTQAIHREVVKKYEGEVTPRSIGPEGRELEFYAVADQPECVAAVVRRLIEEDEVLPQDVVVLSSHGKAKSETHARGLDGRLGYVDKYTPTGPCVRFSSIRAFKGLEAPVVVMCELEDTDEASRDQQIYVAMSRARNHCVVVAPPAGR